MSPQYLPKKLCHLLRYPLSHTLLLEMRKIADQKRRQVLECLEQGKSSRQTALECNISKSKVSEIKNSAGILTPRPKSGPKPKLSPREQRLLVQSISSGESKSAVQATKMINSTRSRPVSAETVRRSLKEANFKAKKKVKKPQLTPRHRKARLDWAIAHKDWTEDDWKRVLWTDETKINRLNSDGLEYCWVRPSEVLSERQIQPTVKFGGGSIMVWGCISWFGVGKLGRIEGKMDSAKFINILELNLLPTIDAISLVSDLPSSNSLIFQQDNDPKHTSAKSREWFKSHHISPMQWPAQSPDLNPIEMVWKQVKDKLGRYQEQPRGILELWERTQAEWKKIDTNYCQALIRSMPNRCKLVIKSRGGPIRY